MKNLWNDAEANALIDAYAKEGIESELALRVYTTRLLGGEPRLVLHGGGNTSVKLRVTDLVGDEWEVLCVKGSGWDMGVIEPQGLPAVKLAPLLKARKLKSLSDEDMVALQRANLIDPTSPNPSVETLLHAFLPHKFVDHTHSTAILALVDQEDSKPICGTVFGKTFGFVPYIKPGFDLAKAAAEVYEQDPSVIGLILDKHGIFTFGDTRGGSLWPYDRRGDQRRGVYRRAEQAGARARQAACEPGQARRHCADAARRGGSRQGRRPLRPHDQRFPHLASGARVSQHAPP